MLTWLVRYKSGKEFPNIPHKFTYEHIDRKELDAFVIINSDKDLPVFTVHFDDPRKKLIYRRRTEMPSAARPFHVVCHIIGWHMNVKGESIQNINYVYETIGRKNKKGEKEDFHWIESAGKWDKDRNTWFYSPIMRAYEK